ncbi:MAG: Coenzyme F420 hydrogenase/dehydrogenase, beta subunit C-terminal domain [Thermodesulfobacteriota bacterium]
MKTFANLVEEVQKPGRCRRCGGCVTFCSAINYGALAQDPDGSPHYSDPEKCIECGLCYMLCPVVGELEEEAKRKALWQEPMGNVLGVSVARAKDASIREIATDGGVLTAILLRLFDEGRIDGAVLAKGAGPFLRRPFLATTRKEILEAAASFAGPPHGRDLAGDRYSTFASAISALGDQLRQSLRRVACVGLPGQILTIRKMQVLGVVPTDSLYCLLGLFCSGHFEFGQAGRKRLEKLGGFAWSEVEKINVKDALHIHARGREMITIPLEELDFMRRYACRFCTDYGAEYADLSCGGLGAEAGWTTVVTRTPLGRAILADAVQTVVEVFPEKTSRRVARQALEAVEQRTEWKRARAVRDGEGVGAGSMAAV